MYRSETSLKKCENLLLLLRVEVRSERIRRRVIGCVVVDLQIRVVDGYVPRAGFFDGFGFNKLERLCSCDAFFKEKLY